VTERAVVSGIRLAYDLCGDGEPLVAIMGFAATRHHWYGFERRLARGFRVLSFDNRGSGESEIPPGLYAMEQFAKDTLGLMDAVGIEAAHVLGASMGGMIAQELAILAPQRVRSLVLGASHPGGTRQIMPSPDVAAKAIGEGPSAEVIVRESVRVCFSRRFIETHADEFEQMVEYGMSHRLPRSAVFAQLAAIGGHDTWERLGQIRVPTLVITGDADVLVPPENSEILARAIPGARLVVLPGIGHAFWREAADRAEAEMRVFWDGVPTP
jgi:3-oxoadipate enol-lactonase